VILNVIYKTGDAKKIRRVTDVTVNLKANKIVYKQGKEYATLPYDEVLQIQTYPGEKKNHV
jgi:sporulation protein YlmC with PRC-barrel domain